MDALDADLKTADIDTSVDEDLCNTTQLLNAAATTRAEKMLFWHLNAEKDAEHLKKKCRAEVKALRGHDLVEGQVLQKGLYKKVYATITAK